MVSECVLIRESTRSGNAEGVNEPSRGAEGVGPAKHPGADDGDDEVVFTV